MPFERLVKDIKDLKRFEHILLVLIKYRFGHFIEKVNLKRNLPLKERLDKTKFEETKSSGPQRLRMVFEELGGTFVKLGQLLSLRPDLIPHEYCKEFSKLQDAVAPFSAKEAQKIIEDELKKPIGELFKSFDQKPIAAASIGQVHRATLKSGKEVIIKVQRPGIKELIETDLDIMYYLAHLTEKHYKNLFCEPTEIVKEFEKYTKRELNYVLEGKNVQKFYKNFAGSRIVTIPKVYWLYTTEKVLTLEYIEGKKIEEIKGKKGYNPKIIVQNIVDSVLKQIFIDGFFHADPHPGNILILKKNVIAFLDFGIVGFLDEDLKNKMTSFFIAMIQGDLNGIAKGLLNLGFVDYDVDIEHLKEDLHEAFREYYGTQIRYINMSDLFPKIVDIAKRHKIKLPADFVLLGKSLMTTEGFCSGLDPEFNLVNTARPFVKKLITSKKSTDYLIKNIKKTSMDLKEFVINFPSQTRQVIGGIREADSTFKSIDKDLKNLTVEMGRSSSRIALGIMLAAFVIGVAMIIKAEYPTIFGLQFHYFIGLVVAIFLILLLLPIIRNYRNV